MSDLSDYVDLGEQCGPYECQRCGVRFQERFDRHNCPNCDTRNGHYAPDERAKKRSKIDHGPGYTGNSTRTVRL